MPQSQATIQGSKARRSTRANAKKATETKNSGRASGRSRKANGKARPSADQKPKAKTPKNGALTKKSSRKTSAEAKKTGAKTRQAKSKKRKKAAFTAKTADKHVLYQMSVQDAEVEVTFIDKVFRKLRKRRALSLREDFCGTALVCSQWVKSHNKRTATGVDIEPSVLAWGRKHNLEPLGEAKKRVTLHEKDVRDKIPGKFDTIFAFNFSYWIFDTRDAMRDYFKRVRKGLGKDGVFLIDAYGGWEAIEPMYEPRDIKNKFTYVWDQDEFDPITHRIVNYIHFEFKDGTKLNKAFTYKWRYWSVPELTELLKEAGFSNVFVYWDQAEDEDDEDYRITKRAENQPGWLAYLAALK